MSYKEDDKITKKEFDSLWSDFNDKPAPYHNIPAQELDRYTDRAFDERWLNPTLWMKISSFFEQILSIRISWTDLMPNFYNDDGDYNCHCKCDLKECDYVCAEYFSTQDWKPYREVDFNLPTLKYYSEEEKIKSYRHFKKMLKKRNRNPYYALYYFLRKREFNKLLDSQNKRKTIGKL